MIQVEIKVNPGTLEEQIMLWKIEPHGKIKGRTLIEQMPFDIPEGADIQLLWSATGEYVKREVMVHVFEEEK